MGWKTTLHIQPHLKSQSPAIEFKACDKTFKIDVTVDATKRNSESIESGGTEDNWTPNWFNKKKKPVKIMCYVT